MRRVPVGLFMWIAATGLAGCASPQNFEAGLEAAKGSPALRSDLIQKCIRENKFAGEQRRQVAKLINVSERSDVEKTLCTRVMDGMIAKRITYDDYRRASAGQMSPEIIRVVQGR